MSLGYASAGWIIRQYFSIIFIVASRSLPSSCFRRHKHSDPYISTRVTHAMYNIVQLYSCSCWYYAAHLPHLIQSAKHSWYQSNPSFFLSVVPVTFSSNSLTHLQPFILFSYEQYLECFEHDFWVPVSYYCLVNCIKVSVVVTNTMLPSRYYQHRASILNICPFSVTSVSTEFAAQILMVSFAWLWNGGLEVWSLVLW